LETPVGAVHVDDPRKIQVFEVVVDDALRYLIITIPEPPEPPFAFEPNPP
jgi:hypothetical protein